MSFFPRLLFLLAALTLALNPALAETTDAPQETIIALVNGEALLESDYIAVENAYLSDFVSAGYDLSDEAAMGYVKDLALTSAIERLLIEQDMRAQGCYDFDDATNAWIAEESAAAYETALDDVGEMIRETLALDEEEDMREYALTYAKTLGVTQEDYADVYRTQMATALYNNWLIRDNPITDEAVFAAYSERVEHSRALYENDVPAFEAALSAGADVWFKPEGYRSVLQILLPAQGETDEEKLASAEDALCDISSRLAAGESFEALIREYGTDAAFEDDAFFSVGYQVHRESILWEEAFIAAAFSEEMAAPGGVSKPFASTLGVHVLYYLGESEGGAIELTEAVSELLAAALYSEQTQEALAARVDALAESAEVTIY